jgi:hypothetical protein
MFALGSKPTSALPVLLLILSACGTAEDGEGSPEAAPRDPELRAELLAMRQADQEVRDRVMVLAGSGGSGALRTDNGRKLLEEMAAVDRRNQLRLDEIASQRGWPGASLVGNEAESAVLLMLAHARIDQQERYVPMLRQAVEDGRARAASLAELEDEISVARTGSQIYGTEIALDVDTGAPRVVPIIDPEGLDARRAAMGLAPIGEHLRQAEAELGVPVDRSALAYE